MAGGTKILEVRDRLADVEGVKAKLEDAYELPPYEVHTSAAWRSRLSEAKQLTAEKLCDVVYAMASQGATIPLIARYWGLKEKDIINVAGDAFAAANAELVLRLLKDQVTFALTTKNPLGKIFAGRQFCGQTEDGALFNDMGQKDVNTGGITVSINVAKANRDEQGVTIKTEEPAETAEDAAQLH